MTWPADKPLPQNLEAERALLAAPILDAGSILRISQEISETHFFLPAHKKIFRAQQLLASENKPIDPLTLSDQLRKQGDLESVGGELYLWQITDGVPRVQNVRHYAAIVRDAAERRELIHLADELQQDADCGEKSARKIKERTTEKLLELLGKDGSASLPCPWPTAVTSALEEIAQSFDDPGSVMRLKFGIRDLDEVTSGFRRKDVVLIVGQTSHGKSALAMQLAINSDQVGCKGLIFSAEMSREALATRELVHTAGIPLYYTRRPELVRDKSQVLKKLLQAAVIESKRSLLVVDRDITPARVKTLCELVHRTSGLDFVIVDYDQLVVRAALTRPEQEFAMQARFAADALAIAKRLDVCFVLLCQPRKVEPDVARGRRGPRVEDIFGHSAVGNTAHHILWVIRRFFQKDKDPAYERQAVIHVLKARNDKPASVEVDFDPDAVLFQDKAPTEKDSVEEPAR